MPIYEFRCERCGAHFEELLAAGTESAACRDCGAPARRLISAQAPVAKLVKGPAAQRRQERRNATLRREAKASFKAARRRARARADKRDG